MKKSFDLIKEQFISSCTRTKQYLDFHRTFKREFKAYLKELGITEIEISKPNHFDISGFFKINNQIWYFSIDDLRWSKDNMLIRTAKDFKDYTGGTNQYVSLDNETIFKKQLLRIISEVD